MTPVAHFCVHHNPPHFTLGLRGCPHSASPLSPQVMFVDLCAPGAWADRARLWRLSLSQAHDGSSSPTHGVACGLLAHRTAQRAVEETRNAAARTEEQSCFGAVMKAGVADSLLCWLTGGSAARFAPNAAGRRAAAARALGAASGALRGRLASRFGPSERDIDFSKRISATTAAESSPSLASGFYNLEEELRCSRSDEISTVSGDGSNRPNAAPLLGRRSSGGGGDGGGPQIGRTTQHTPGHVGGRAILFHTSGASGLSERPSGADGGLMTPRTDWRGYPSDPEAGSADCPLTGFDSRAIRATVPRTLRRVMGVAAAHTTPTPLVQSPAALSSRTPLSGGGRPLLSRTSDTGRASDTGRGGGNSATFSAEAAPAPSQQPKAPPRAARSFTMGANRPQQQQHLSFVGHIAAAAAGALPSPPAAVPGRISRTAFATNLSPSAVSGRSGRFSFTAAAAAAEELSSACDRVWATLLAVEALSALPGGVVVREGHPEATAIDRGRAYLESMARRTLRHDFVSTVILTSLFSCAG